MVRVKTNYLTTGKTNLNLIYFRVTTDIKIGTNISFSDINPHN